ncbi:MAG: hypothetical protein LBN31_13655 [Hungatella sp.]|jgi:hypothetical protein|nr:hypothetical protein [Hungatella sp.]
MYFEFTEKNYYIDDDEREKDYSTLECQRRTLIKKLHPDNGGNNSEFDAMSDEYKKYRKVIADTRIISNETYKIGEFIKQQNHPDYPNYSKGYNTKLWNYYSYLYRFHQNFTELDEQDEITRLSTLDIKKTFPLYGRMNSNDIQIFFNSGRKSIDRSIEPIFQGLRGKLKTIYPGLNFTFAVSCGGDVQSF